MSVDTLPERDNNARPALRWQTVALVLGLYSVCAAVATYPRILSLGTTLPSRVDPVTHLALLRWYKTCLMEGRSPLYWPDIQYPVGAPLGLFTPMHLQALLYLLLSSLISNDILCYNLLWFGGFLLAGMGTFVLAWEVVRHRAAACFGGLLAMLGGPMMLHARGHLEFMYVGLFPLFLTAWMRLVDRPGRGRLASAALLYLLMVMGAAYFAVLAVTPAALFVVHALACTDRLGRVAWLRSRAAWLGGFVLLVVPGLLLLFAGQLLGAARGERMALPLVDYVRYGATAWGYVMPTSLHALHRIASG
jgi:hypothetical protein